MLNPLRQSEQPKPPKLAALRSRYQPILRDSMADLLGRIGLTAPKRFVRGALTVVTFHRVLPQERLRLYPIPGLGVTPEQLEAILCELSHHFECLPMIGAFRRWQEPKVSGRPPLAITFDDGALDNYAHARPVLDKLSLKATFYIPVDNVDTALAPWHDRLGFALLKSVAMVRKLPEVDFDRLLAPFGCGKAAFAAILPDEAVRLAAEGVSQAKRLSPDARAARIDALESALGGQQVPDWAGMMSWDQIRELSADGHEIGSHSLTHPLLPELDSEALRNEIVTSRSRLRAATGSEVASFCYPNGSYDGRCLAAVRDAGYACAVTTTWGLNRRASPFELKRCDMDFARLQSRRGEFSKARLYLRLSGLQPGLGRAAQAHY